jgi:predicted ABC-type ATPase
MNKAKENPIMFVLAGNNGSGKSTVRRSLLEKQLNVKVNIDPDLVAKQYKTTNETNPDLKAGRDVIRLVNQLIDNKESFSYETTLSGKSSINRIKKAKENGYKIMLYFVGLENVSLNIHRVIARRESGGHFIPKEDILRRNNTITKNLLDNLQLFDYLQILDNTDEKTKIILEYENSQVKYCSDKIPNWSKIIVEILRQEEK